MKSFALGAKMDPEQPQAQGENLPPSSEGRVGVLIIEEDLGGQTGARNEYLNGLFSSSLFQRAIYKKGSLAEALTKANELWGDKPALLVLNSSVSQLHSETLAEKIRLVLEQGLDYDLCYLCKWNDQCQKYINVDLEEEDVGGHLVVSSSPHGLQAVIYTRQARDILLGAKEMRNGGKWAAGDDWSSSINKEILKGNFKAICFVPNLLDYDISLARDDSDYLKLNECQKVEPQQARSSTNATTSASATTSWIWLLFIIILVILLAWAVIRVGPR
jgi:hypothetical protein